MRSIIALLLSATMAAANPLITLSGSPPAAVSGTDPTVLWWKLNAGSGTTITAEAGPNGSTDASWSAGTQSGSGSCLEFNGTDDDALTTSNIAAGSNVITVTLWVRAVAWPGDKVLIQLGGNPGETDNSFRIIDYGDLLFQVYSSGERLETISALSTGAWHFIAAVLDNSTASGDIKVYIDGSLQSTGLGSDSKTTTGNFATETVFVGAGFSGQFFEGRIDDVRIYNSELSAGDISTLYSAGAQ